MGKGLRGAVKSNGYDHYITPRWGCMPRSVTYIYIYIYELGPASFCPGMPRVVNACKPSPRSDTPSGYWLCD